jgi:hypothetical protein
MDLVIQALANHAYGYDAEDVIRDERAHRACINTQQERAVALFVARAYRIDTITINALDEVNITGWLNDDNNLIDGDAVIFDVTFRAI